MVKSMHLLEDKTPIADLLNRLPTHPTLFGIPLYLQREAWHSYSH